MEEKPSYYAIIPANVRYDKDLPPNAKLLYGEITALCNSLGFCWASNNYFAELYGVSKASISSWISKLIEGEYIFSEIIYKPGTKEVDKRVLKISCIPVQDFLNTPIQNNLYTPHQEILNTPIQEKLKDNSTVVNNTPVNNYSSFTDVKEEPQKTKPVKKTTRKKPKPKAPQVAAPPPPEYARFIDLYHNWFIGQEGIPPKIDGLAGKGAKDIIKYLRTIVTNKATRENRVISEVELQNDALSAWAIVLDNWKVIETYYQDKTKLNEISSNIQNIIIQVKNGSPKKKQQSNSQAGTVTGQTVVDAISQRFNKS